MGRPRSDHCERPVGQAEPKKAGHAGDLHDHTHAGSRLLSFSRISFSRSPLLLRACRGDARLSLAQGDWQCTASAVESPLRWLS
jgi:hypothetical protein